MNEHTTHFACADAGGTVVTVTQTLGVPFGSGFAVPGTGIVLNNILKWMDRAPESPNVLGAGRKAGTMMSPTQVFQDGAFVMSIGTPGSYGILQTTPQMLLNVLEFGMNIQEAIEAPRVRVYRDRLIDAEARIPADTRTALAGRGHPRARPANCSIAIARGLSLRRASDRRRSRVRRRSSAVSWLIAWASFCIAMGPPNAKYPCILTSRPMGVNMPSQPGSIRASLAPQAPGSVTDRMGVRPKGTAHAASARGAARGLPRDQASTAPRRISTRTGRRGRGGRGTRRRPSRSSLGTRPALAPGRRATRRAA